MIKRVKNTVPWTYLINDHNGKQILEVFTKKNDKKQIRKKFRIENVIKKIVINYMLNGKDTIICLIAG